MNQTTTPGAHGEPDAATSRKSGSAGGGEETTGRKTGTGASPPTQREAAGGGLLLCCLQDSIAWLARQRIEVPWRVRGRLARLPRKGSAVRTRTT
jgi:hypothetical protein